MKTALREVHPKRPLSARVGKTEGPRVLRCVESRQGKDTEVEAVRRGRGIVDTDKSQEPRLAQARSACAGADFHPRAAPMVAPATKPRTQESGSDGSGVHGHFQLYRGFKAILG